MESLEAYVPLDRRLAMAQRQELPERTSGAALFADISGFTPLTDALVRSLGPQRGAEELPQQLNRVYDAVIAQVERYGGSVIGFSGDAISCWFDRDTGLRAVAGALAIQQAMEQFRSVAMPDGSTVGLTIKVAVATGAARRFVVGSAETHMIDVLAGATLERLAEAEHHARTGEVVLDPQTSLALADHISVAEWRADQASTQRFAVVAALRSAVPPASWSAPAGAALSDAQLRPWLLAPVYQRLHSGQGEFLTELRPAVAVFVRFMGIDYDHDAQACEKLGAYVGWVQGVLDAYGGFLIQLTVGDKGSYLYAAFGAPIAHHDDATRAVAAALVLRTLPSDLSFIESVQIGISSGRMRTGSYGGSTARTYGVLGPETNMAARLMQHAEPGQVLVSLAAQHETEAQFVWERLPPLKVKGKAEPAIVFRLLAARERRDVRLQEPRYALPMVGRAAELAVAEQRLTLVERSKGQILAITAEAGMGKSRLVAEIIRRAATRQLAAYGGECQSYGIHNSYLVWENLWASFFGIDPEGPLDEQVHILEQHVAAIDPLLLPRVPLLGAVLNLPIADNDLTRPLDAKLRKASLEALLVDCLRARAAAVPLLFVLEDCHWLDPLSHDLLETIGRAIGDLPVLIVVSYRPPEIERLQAPRVTQLPYCTTIRLPDFTAQEAAQLIGSKLALFGTSATEPAAGLVERITERAQGNPFYIEELLNYVRDLGLDAHDQSAVARLELPASLQSLILSRIDQLSESQKSTLKVASIIGRLFKLDWLWGVHPQLGDLDRVKADLDGLSRLDLTPLDQPEPELSYLFKHIVTREVAYESLPFGTRTLLHGQLGDYIEQAYAETVEQYIDLLAHHYDLGPKLDKRREYLRKAGEAAQGNYANDAAIDYFQRLLPLLIDSERVAVMLRLGQVLELVGEWARVQELYRQGLIVAGRLDDRQAEAQFQTALGELLRKQGDYAAATELLQQARTSFETVGDQPGVGKVLHFSGTLASQQGDFARARAMYEASLAIRQAISDQPAIASLLNNLGIVAHLQGDFVTARQLYEQSLERRREIGDKAAIAVSLNNLGMVLREENEPVPARAMLEESLALARELGNKYAVGNSLNNIGQMAFRQGEYASARAMLTESLEINRELGDRDAICYVLEDFGYLAAAQSQNERALRLAGAAAALRAAIGAPLSPSEQAEQDRTLQQARQTLGQAAGSAWAAGHALTMEQAIELAFAAELTVGASPATPDD